MAVVITSQKFTYPDFPVLDSGTDYLIGYPGDKVIQTTDCYVKVSSENISVITAEDSNSNTIRRTDSGSFLNDGFRIGNSMAIIGIDDAGNYGIANVSDKIITITTTFSTKKDYTQCSIYRTNDLNSSNFYYNLIENDSSDSFISLIDNQTTQKYNISGISATGSTQSYSIASISQSWAIDQNGYGVTIIGMGISNYRYSFRIIQTFIITPIALISQLFNLQNGIPPAPDWFQDHRALKHVSKIEFKIDATNPDIVDTITFSRRGNTGWFDEFLSGEPAKYSLASNYYTHTSGGDVIASIDYINDTNANISITSASATFTTGTTAIVHMIYIPSDDSDYINTTSKFRHAFAYDRANCYNGITGTGFNSGTSDRQIKSALLTFVNSTAVNIVADISLASDLQNRINGKSDDNRNYFLFVTIQSPTISATNRTDRIAIKVDCNSYFANKDDATLFQISPAVSFSDLSGNNLGNSVVGNGGDFILSTIPFKVKNAGSQKLQSIGVRIQAQTTGGTNAFTLEETIFDMSSYCLQDGIQQLAISQDKNYQLPENNPLNNIIVERMKSLDNTNYACYNLYYPFQLRYEDWRLLNGADCTFGNATQDWSVISNRSGWEIKLIITASVYDPATSWTTDFEQSNSIVVNPPSATGSTGTWCIITTYDSSNTNNQFGNVFLDQPTLVVADFYGNFSYFPTGAIGYYGILYLDQQQIGGTIWVQPFSTQQDVRIESGISPWIPTTGTTGTATLIKISNAHIQLSGMLNHQLLSASINNYDFRAKLDYIYAP